MYRADVERKVTDFAGAKKFRCQLQNGALFFYYTVATITARYGGDGRLSRFHSTILTARALLCRLAEHDCIAVSSPRRFI